MRTLIATELEKDFNKLQSILNFDGNPLTADFIVEEFIGRVKEDESLSRLIKKIKSAA